MKNYLPDETKEQRKVRKAQEKMQKSSPVLDTNHSSKRYVACLKFGKKYGPEYVNTLYRMVDRNLTLDYEFVCFTEDTKGLDPHIRTESLPFSAQIQGWWYKPYFLDPKLCIQGTILFIDLDVIVFRNIDNLFTYNPEQFMIIRDFNRCRIKNYDKFNSSIFRLNTGQHSHVYSEFVKDPSLNSRRFHGDQDWIRNQVKTGFEYWPEEWIQSYKWEMRNKPQMTRGKNGKRNFATPGEPDIKPDTSVAVFHGDPNPHDCVDPWCQQHWH